MRGPKCLCLANGTCLQSLKGAESRCVRGCDDGPDGYGRNMTKSGYDDDGVVRDSGGGGSDEWDSKTQYKMICNNTKMCQ